jgi:Ser/Thr protein kinase RdoA (MazF antagonist)
MSASKDRLRWNKVPESTRAAIEALVGGRVAAAENRAGGFSPGLASRLTLDDGRRVFVKAMDGDAWPLECAAYRAEALVVRSLPASLPAPAFIGSFDDGRWVVLALEAIDGLQPDEPWDRETLARAVRAAVELTEAVTPSPVALPREHPRLGGWIELAAGATGLARLAEVSMWAADILSDLVVLEADGLAAAQGSSLVHFDLYPHNMLVTADRIVFVDWPHARLGAPIVDLIMLLSSAAADGIDPEPFLQTYAAAADPFAVDAILAAHAGFLLAGGLLPVPSGLEAIAAAKCRLGHGAVAWLERRRRRW